MNCRKLLKIYSDVTTQWVLDLCPLRGLQTISESGIVLSRATENVSASGLYGGVRWGKNTVVVIYQNGAKLPAAS
jgi:hypothetical protein